MLINRYLIMARLENSQFGKNVDRPKKCFDCSTKVFLLQKICIIPYPG